MRTFLMILVFVLVVPTSGGCSVAMALKGQRDPDLSMMAAGATRANVESEFGAPSLERSRDDGSVECTYEYTIGDEPNLGRALIHGAFNALSLGIWEVAGTGIESAVEEHDRALVVVYDESEHVVSVRRTALRPDEVAAVVDD